MSLDAKIEAILFFKAEPQTAEELAKYAGANEEEVEAALLLLERRLEGGGVALVRSGAAVELRTSAGTSALIEKIQKEELAKDLGRAGSETLSIILYRGPATRAEIDYVRGVNSTYILRNLLIRGLIEKVPNPKDQRSFLYQPTIELLSFLGVSHVRELPEFDKVAREFESFEKQEHTLTKTHDDGEGQ